MPNLIQKMLQSILNKKILLTSFLLTSNLVFAVDVGDITEHSGSAGITRQGDSFQTTLGLGVEMLDNIVTANGRIKMTFVDDTVLRLTEHTEVIIDEYYYDPNQKASARMAMNFVTGTARFATGSLGLVPKENIVIRTPTAVIGIRGTDFTTSVDELGRSLVILLPESECTVDGDCSPSGEITVTNDGGTVTLTEAYSATMVSSLDKIPTPPVVLDNINLNMIDNMFIVNPPSEIQQAVEESSTAANDTSNSILDFTDLDTDYLANDFLAQDDLEFTELDMDLLDVDFLQDVLVAIESIDILRRGTRSAQGTTEFTGTSLGFDKETQYNSIIDTGMGQLWFYREVNAVVSVRVPIGSNTTLESTNEDKKSVITVGDGSSVIIIINQSG